MKNKDDILKIVRSTREISFPFWGNITSTTKESNERNIVTEIDTKVEMFLQESFYEIDPNTSFVGEETGGDKTAGRFWLVDPIDGTQHYVRGLPFCTTMVSLIESGQVTFSAIYDFVNDVLYHAEIGNGAYADEEKISVSNRSAAAAFICYESNWNTGDSLEKHREVRKKIQTLQFSCSGYEHILVATGKIEGRVGYHPYAQDHDIAPGSLLIKEAGGIVTNIGSETFDYQNTNYIATNKAVYDSLVYDTDAAFPIIR